MKTVLTATFKDKLTGCEDNPAPNSIAILTNIFMAWTFVTAVQHRLSRAQAGSIIAYKIATVRKLTYFRNQIDDIFSNFFYELSSDILIAWMIYWLHKWFTDYISDLLIA